MNGRPSKPEVGQLLEDYDWIKFVEYVFSLDLSGDGQTCRINSTKTGKQLTIIFPEPAAPGQVSSAADTEYNGYLKLIDVSTKAGEVTTYKVKVVNGADTASATAGYYQHGLSNIAVPVSSELTITASGYVYVTITYDGNYVFTFAFAQSVPASTQGHIVREIAKITMASGSMSISQSQFGPLITAGVL